jgi:hypothetical protein
MSSPPSTSPQTTTTTKKESQYQLNEWRTFYNSISLTLALTMPLYLLIRPPNALSRYRPIAIGLLALGIEGQFHYHTGHSSFWWAGYPARKAAERRKRREELPGQLERVMEEEVQREDERRRGEVLREVEVERRKRLEMEEKNRLVLAREVEERRMKRWRWDFFWNRDGVARGLEADNTRREG